MGSKRIDFVLMKTKFGVDIAHWGLKLNVMVIKEWATKRIFKIKNIYSQMFDIR